MSGWSPAEAILFATTLGSLARWYFERRDARSAMAEAKKAADKTVETLTATIDAKNEELAEVKEDRDYLRERVAHLEVLAFGERGS